jgi:hypothetical protein
MHGQLLNDNQIRSTEASKEGRQAGRQEKQARFGLSMLNVS